MSQRVKNPPAVWEIWVQSLGWEDPLEEGMATHLSIFADSDAGRDWGQEEKETTEDEMAGWHH